MRVVVEIELEVEDSNAIAPALREIERALADTGARASIGFNTETDMSPKQRMGDISPTQDVELTLDVVSDYYVGRDDISPRSAQVRRFYDPEWYSRVAAISTWWANVNADDDKCWPLAGDVDALANFDVPLDDLLEGMEQTRQGFLNHGDKPHSLAAFRLTAQRLQTEFHKQDREAAQRHGMRKVSALIDARVGPSGAFASKPRQKQLESGFPQTLPSQPPL